MLMKFCIEVTLGGIQRIVDQGQYVVSGTHALLFLYFLRFSEWQQGSDPKGMMSFRMQGIFVRLSIRPFNRQVIWNRSTP